MKFFALISAAVVVICVTACASDKPNQPMHHRHGVPIEVVGPHPAVRVVIPPGPPPKHLVVEEVRKGTGPALRTLKDKILVNYAGIEYSNGEEFYDSWTEGGPNKFIFEETHKGWELGLMGMRQGGIRKLITPPRLEYGTDTLIYIVELVRVKPAGR